MAAALDKLGRLRGAADMCRQAVEAFPGNSNLKLMLDELAKQAERQDSAIEAAGR